MNSSKRRFAVDSAFVVFLSPLLLVVNAGMIDVPAPISPLTYAAAQTAKQQCTNVCRARYRDCLSLKQIPSFECRGVYQDCKRYTCDALRG